MVIHYRKYVFFFKYINYFFHFVYLLFFYGRVRGHMLGFEIEQCCGMCSMRIPQTHTRHKRRPSEMILDKNKKNKSSGMPKGNTQTFAFCSFSKTSIEWNEARNENIPAFRTRVACSTQYKSERKKLFNIARAAAGILDLLLSNSEWYFSRTNNHQTSTFAQIVSIHFRMRGAASFVTFHFYIILLS